MFVSHKQFQHGRVWCQDNSRIISHCRTSTRVAKKIRLLSLASLSACVLVIVSHPLALLFSETRPSAALLCCHFNLPELRAVEEEGWWEKREEMEGLHEEAAGEMVLKNKHSNREAGELNCKYTLKTC